MANKKWISGTSHSSHNTALPFMLSISATSIKSCVIILISEKAFGGLLLTFDGTVEYNAYRAAYIYPHVCDVMLT